MYLLPEIRALNFITCSANVLYAKNETNYCNLFHRLVALLFVPISSFRDKKIRRIFLWRITYTIFKMSPVWKVHLHTPKFSTSSGFYTEWTFLNERRQHHQVYHREFSFHQFLQIRYIRCLFLATDGASLPNWEVFLP